MRKTIILVALVAFASPVQAQYEIRISADTQDIAVSLNLVANSETPTKLMLRGAAWGLQPQVDNVRCASGPLPQDTDGNWTAPAGCKTVTWTVVPDRLSPEGADASEQRSLVGSPGPWFLLSEPTSLLRPQPTEAATIRAAPGSGQVIGATSVEAGVFRVPPSGSAPEFYVLGSAALSRRTVGAVEITYVADNPLQVEELGLEQSHARALEYLSQIVRPPKGDKASQRALLVIWLGVPSSRGRVGGAAGNNSFVANYIIGPAVDDKVNTAMATAIIAHEQFHQLAGPLRNGRAALPVWLGESLAHYYGLKALLIADSSESTHAVRSRFIDSQRSVDFGLLELNRKYASGDQVVYGLFYSQGATFWHAVDVCIVDATSGRKSLDDYVRELLRAPIPDDGSLPDSFIAKLRDVAGPNIEPLFSKYLGR